MPPEIIVGHQHGKSQSTTELIAGRQSDLKLILGNQHDESERQLTINLTDGVCAKGSFFTIAFAALATVIGTLAYSLPWYFVPVAVVGSVLALYLLGIMLLPTDRLSEKRFVSVLSSYIRLAFAVNPKKQS